MESSTNFLKLIWHKKHKKLQENKHLNIVEQKIRPCFETYIALISNISINISIICLWNTKLKRCYYKRIGYSNLTIKS